MIGKENAKIVPAAFGRLCVETVYRFPRRLWRRPAAFGRLCVETWAWENFYPIAEASRLRAAVC